MDQKPEISADAVTAGASPGSRGWRAAGRWLARVVLLAVVTAGAPALAAERVALVIGNASYADAPLNNPVNDAKGMAATLTRLGFSVQLLTDADRRTMERGILRFAAELQPGSAALFYYAGHGVQSRGRNYLLPVDAQIDSEGALRFEAVDVSQLLEEITLKRARVNFVILDACRNNPFEGRMRGAGKGLAAIDAAQGTLIAYATAPGSVAVDGAGDHGLYTDALLQALEIPGLKAEDVFKRVRVRVSEQSNGLQVPWESSSLTGDFVFNASTVALAPETGAPGGGASVERSLWESAHQIGTPGAYREYLKAFPDGVFAGLARLQLEGGPEPSETRGVQCDISGVWRTKPENGCESVLRFTRVADGSYQMKEENCWRAQGSARVDGRQVVIDWSVGLFLCNGTTRVEMSPDCQRASGEAVMPANFVLCAGRLAVTMERLPDGGQGR